MDEGDAAKFPAPDDQRFVEESAAFEVLNQCPDGLVDDEGILGGAVAEAPVLVPGVAATEARGGDVGEFDEADTALHQTASQ